MTGWRTLEWPPRSPDLSPIEFVWGLMVQEIDTNHNPRNVEELTQAVKEAWWKVTRPAVLQTCFNRAFSNMRRCCEVAGDNKYIKNVLSVRRSFPA